MKHTKPKTKRKYKRPGKLSNRENTIIKEIVRESTDLTLPQTQALARVFNRSVGSVKGAITRARTNLQADAEFYVDEHRTVVAHATNVALATNDPKVMDVARRGAEWAIERISAGGKRIVDKAEVTAPAGVNVMVGVRLGNVSMQPEVTIGAIEGETLEE